MQHLSLKKKKKNLSWRHVKELESCYHVPKAVPSPLKWQGWESWNETLDLIVGSQKYNLNRISATTDLLHKSQALVGKEGNPEEGNRAPCVKPASSPHLKRPAFSFSKTLEWPPMSQCLCNRVPVLLKKYPCTPAARGAPCAPGSKPSVRPADARCWALRHHAQSQVVTGQELLPSVFSPSLPVSPRRAETSFLCPSTPATSKPPVCTAHQELFSEHRSPDICTLTCELCAHSKVNPYNKY